MQSDKPSRFYLRRTQLGLEQKQVAQLLGKKTIFQYSRLENEQRPGSLKDAIKLSLIFGVPIQSLFGEVYEQCKLEVSKQLKNSVLAKSINLENNEFCPFLEIMNAERIGYYNAEKVRHHIKVLVDERRKKILKD